jgi:transposase
VESQARRESELRRLEKNLEKASLTASKKLQNLGNQKFDNPQTAITSATQLAKKLKYHKLADIKVVELQPEPIKKASALAGNIIYKIQASLVRDQSGIDTETRCAGRFVLATNVLDAKELSLDEMLSEYKAQQSAERGFGFLKDPLFFTDSLFLKSPERVEALAMLMGKWFVSLHSGTTTATSSIKTIAIRNKKSVR